MDLSPLSGEQQEVLIGVLLGVGVALFAQYLFPWRNLRWTWALFAVPIGGVALLAGIVESWSVALPLCAKGGRADRPTARSIRLGIS